MSLKLWVSVSVYCNYINIGVRRIRVRVRINQLQVNHSLRLFSFWYLSCTSNVVCSV